jgi:single-strand selective monofunctional uracil DNA glycosylase
MKTDTPTRLKDVYQHLRAEVDALKFAAPVSHVYNPLAYARVPVEQYLDLAGQDGKEVMFLGMNPGPWGMAQTGVPFGTVSLVEQWIGIRGPVMKPAHEHPRRPVSGFETTREEVSGTRFWGWVRDRFETPDRFFSRFFVANYCPLVFMEESGRNRTPDKLALAERQALFEVCDRALRQVVEILRPRIIVGVGKFAEDRARALFGNDGPEIGRILHPSPASPLANRGWVEPAERQLRDLGIRVP